MLRVYHFIRNASKMLQQYRTNKGCEDLLIRIHSLNDLGTTLSAPEFEFA
ncbi:MAG: hypothetical protein K0R76_851 [Alphaproteobacteria bacterium]|jgi:hypothetical protein|nr:hypothetical protein [Alphaproteobacteria bacterium]